MFPNMGAIRRPVPYEILGRIRRHFVGRVVTLAAATVFNAILSVALLPLATRQLGASDYGIYGLVISIVVLVSAAADGGAGLLVPAHYGSASASERARLFVSLALFAGIAASVAGLLMIIPWLWHYRPFSDQPIPFAAVALSVALMPIRAITNISGMIFSVTDRGLAIAAQLAVQSLATFLSTLIALFEFEMGVTSLFIGAFCGQFAALGVGLVALGRHHVSSSPSREWLRRAAGNSPTTAASGIVDGTRGFGENALLTSAINLHAVGILGHARLYHGLLMALSNAVGHNLWAKSLDEARNPHSSFEITRSAWTPVQIAVTCAGIIFVFVGREIIDLIGNGKFTEAAPYIPALFVIALIQTTEQPANAVVCALGRAASATWTRITLAVGSFIALYPAIVLFGIKGIIAICIIEAVVYRVYLRLLASRERKIPFQDHVAVFGCFAISAEIVYVHWAVPALALQLVLTAASLATLFVIGRRSVGEMISAGRQIVLGRPSTIARDGWKVGFWPSALQPHGSPNASSVGMGDRR
jgi:O-antigen/teichoic acid export membrane protein